MQTAVVTGASYGLGKAICEKLLTNNYRVYGLSRSKPNINSPHFIWLEANLVDDKSITQSLQQIEESHLDLLVNNAGRAICQKTHDYTDQAFGDTFDLNFKAPIKVTVGLLPQLTGGLIASLLKSMGFSPGMKFVRFSVCRLGVLSG